MVDFGYWLHSVVIWLLVTFSGYFGYWLHSVVIWLLVFNVTFSNFFQIQSNLL